MMLLTITSPDHLLYGSDYPYQPAAVLEKALTKMRQWPDAVNILRNNAMRLFGKDDKVGAPLQDKRIIRLSRVEVYSEYLREYIKNATEVGRISLQTEPGVLTMYALQDKENPSIITILETYANDEAYKSHISSPHFLKYKQATLHMVKDLQLIDQTELNTANRVINFINE